MLSSTPSMSISSFNKTKTHQLESAMNEIEKLRRENDELKNQVSDYRRVLRQSNSQGSLQIMPLDTIISPVDIVGNKEMEPNQV